MSLGDTNKRWDNVHANIYYGDGSQLTGISTLQVPGTDGMILYSSSGTLGGSNVFKFDSTTNHMSVGTSQTLATLQVHDAATPNPLSNVGDPSLYQLGLSGSGSSSNGIGISFGDTNNVGAGIVFDDMGGEAKGSLRFFTKNSTVRGADPVETLTLRYDGNVGVGISNPLSKFEVNTSIGLSKTAVDAGEMKFRLSTNTQDD